jgi:hypothetical protein
MNLYWVYDLPLAALGVGIVAAFVLVVVLGLILTRGLVARLAGSPPGMNSLVSSSLSPFGVLYGLTVGLVAVTTWQSHSRTEAAAGSEAAVVAALYRDVSSYPEPFRQDLQSLLKG